MKVGSQIQKLRKEKKMTQAQLAEKIETSPTLISHIERGKADPSIKTLDKIARVLGCPVSTIFQRAEKEAQIFNLSESKVTPNRTNRTANQSRQNPQLPAVPRRGRTGVRAAKGRKAPTGGKA